MSILLSNISKNFGEFTALDGINLEIAPGELTALLGPSGCGKTTLLRIIAGLETQDQGSVLINSKDVSRQHVSRRGIGFVFQHYALFRHMTVFDNIAFGLRVKPRKERPSEAIITNKVNALLELVQLDWFAERFPSQLSGGQRQRIALARALAMEPNVLLLDEPFGALDASVRKDLRCWMRQLHHKLNVTSIFVTHDQEEAMEVANQVVVLNQGRIEQQGTPDEIYEGPINSFVSRFVGQTNVLNFDQQETAWLNGAVTHPENQKCNVAHVRPHNIDINKVDRDGASPAILKDWLHLGAKILIELLNPDNRASKCIYAEISSERFKELSLNKGDKVYLFIKKAHWFY